EGLVAGVLDVVTGLLRDATLIASLRPATLIVPAVDVVDDARHLSHRVTAAYQDARELPVDEEDAVAVGSRQSRERLDERRVVDHDLARDRAGQLDDLEEPRAGGGEHHGSSRPAEVELSLEVGADALEVAFQLLLLRVVQVVLPEAAFDDVEQRFELDGPV